MDLGLTEEQQNLVEAAQRFVQSEAPHHLVTDWYRHGTAPVRQLYESAARLGWIGMTVPTAFGGAGSSMLDCALVFEQLGAAPMPGPLFTAGVLVPQVVLAIATPQQRTDLLPRISNGATIVGCALGDDGLDWSAENVATLLETSDEGKVRISGTKSYVQDVEGCDTILCAVRHGGQPDGDAQSIRHVLVPLDAPGVGLRPVDGLVNGVSTLDLDDVVLPLSAVLGEGSTWDAADRACTGALPILSAYKVGGSQAVADMTAEYSRTRVLYGRPIGRLQRVQDHCIEIVNHTDAARWVTYEALWLADTGMDAAAAAHETKAVASESYLKACDFAHMVFAGPGSDYGHPLMPHSIRSRTLYPFLGDPRHHRLRMMDQLYGVR